MMNTSHVLFFRANEQGATIVEFAILATVFLTMLLGIMEFGRYLFEWNAAVEATRLGARLAVVCDLDDAQIKTRMQNIMPQLAGDNITITYSPAGCFATSAAGTPVCESVTVTLTDSADSPILLPMISPFVSLVSPLLPPFSTSLPRESMESSSGGYINPQCV